MHTTEPGLSAPLTCQRDAFQLPRDAHYFNCAYMGPLPRAAEEAGVAALAKKRVPTRIVPPDDFWNADQSRALFAELVNVDDPQRIAIHPGVSYGVACVARNVTVSAGQNIVMTYEQFPGNVYSWRRLAAESGAEIRAPKPPEGAGRGEAWNQLLLEAIDTSTAVVTMPHVHWTDGTRFDLVEIGRRCREVGAVFVVDGTQSVGALPFDVAAVQPDALLCAAYKWLLGPYSVGFGYFGPRFDDGVSLEETWIARQGSEDFQRLVDYQDAYQPGAIRYDMAERANFFLLPIAEASLRLLLEWQPERIQAYTRQLTAGMLEEVAQLGYTVEDEAWRSSHLFGLRMPSGLDLAALRDSLATRNITASLRGSALRLAANVYNDEHDVEVLLGALREAV